MMNENEKFEIEMITNSDYLLNVMKKLNKKKFCFSENKNGFEINCQIKINLDFTNDKLVFSL